MKLCIALSSALALSVCNVFAASSPPSYKQSAVFFELIRDGYVDPTNDDLLAQGRIDIKPFGVESVAGFDWRRHERTDRSWWLRMERLDYLLSLIESDDLRVRRTAAAWFDGWHKTHNGVHSPNEAAWEGMIAGIRAAVLVRYLKYEEQRQDEMKVVDKLRDAIREHQEFLADERSYEANSNHGMWNALGLFETTRVYANDEYATLALDRLDDLSTRSVSKQGIHREHAPSYHFYFMELLDEYARYFQSLEGFTWKSLDAFVQRRDHMADASYFLVDHKMRVPRIGDSSGSLDEQAARLVPESSAKQWLYDAEGGYAIVKDDKTSPRRRYVVFNNQNVDNQTYMGAHFHQDVGAVYYSDDGEIVLSDGGRYSYTRSHNRQFFVSPAAHNVLLPKALLAGKEAAPFYANRAWMDREDARLTFGVGTYGRIHTRTVEVPENENYFVVNDQLLGDQPFVALWNIGPDVVKIERVGRKRQGEAAEYEWVLTTKRKRQFRLTVTVAGNALSEGDAVHQVKGSRDPFLGWYATGFEKAVKSDVIRIDLKPRGLLRMTTRVERTSS